MGTQSGPGALTNGWVGSQKAVTGEGTPTVCASCLRRARPASPRSALQRTCLSLRRRRPEGSAWRPVEKVVGQGKEAEYLIRKDKVKVPENLPKGDYVLSFRWDAGGAAEVWVSCAFVKLV